jgi:hypothetical protein
MCLTPPSTIYRSGRNREIWALAEDGLYEVLMKSPKPLIEIKASLRASALHGSAQGFRCRLFNRAVALRLTWRRIYSTLQIC